MINPSRGTLARAGDWCQRRPLVLPLLILLVGAAFRYYNLNWDSGQTLHPDERWIFEVVSGANGNAPLSWPASLAQFLDVGHAGKGGSPLDPHFFAYGSLPFYLLAALAATVTFIGQHIPGLSAWSQVDSYAGLQLLGRGLSATLDLLGLVILFSIGRRVFGYWTAVLVMALGACTVLDIQLSHFYTVDTVLLPLSLLTILAAVIISRTERRSAYIWGGVVLGAALATKTTGLLLVIPFAAAAVLAAWLSVPLPPAGSVWERLTAQYASVSTRLNANLQWLLGSFAIAALSFAVFEPYAVIDRQQLVSDIAQQSIYLVTNNPAFVVPYTIQYAHTIPYLYQLKNLLFWDLGMPLALAAFAGVVATLWWNARRHFRPDRVVLLLWVIPYFLFVGKFFAKFSRYMLPIVPIMTLLGAALLVWLVQQGSRGRRILGSAALMAVVVLSFLYSLAYMNIYEHPNTRVAASQWIFAHIPRGSTLVDEGYWDDVLPLPLNGQGCGTYYVCPGLNLYDPDTAQKVSTIASRLSQNQWLVMSSERMVGSIPKLPDRYPITVRYYRLLFAGRLGYQLVHVFQQHPQLGPIVVHDYGADESFHVYDHPIVRIFQRVRSVPAAQITRLLTAGTALASGSPAPQVDTRLMLSPSQWRADQRSATLDRMFPPRGFAMGHPIAVWLLLLELLGLLAFPLCFIVFRNLTDRGYVIAKTIGLVVLGYAVWILVSAGIAPYDRTIIEVVLLGLAILSAMAGWRERRAIVAFVRLEWRVLLAGEAVFLAGFALFILLRLWYPDLGHQFSPVSITNAGDGRMGEKQMELAFLNAIVRSRVFPPYDPFFAHGYINYYYYGFFLIGTLCKLAQIVPATGFNLAIATFFAMLVGNSFSVGLSLTKRIGPGVVAAGAVGLIGNLAGAWQVVQALMAVGAAHSSVALIGGFIDALSGVWQVVTAHAVLPAFDFWAPTRIVPPGGVISEFPFFTYLFADLHPHLMAFPMTVAALALGLNYVPAGRSSGRRIALSVVLGAILVGAIAATNPWDFPTYLVILAIGAVIGGFMLRRKLTLSALTVPLLQVAGIAALSALLYLPFKQSYQTVFATGIGLVRDITPQMLESTGVCPSATHVCSQQLRDAIVTPLGIYLEQFGALLFPIVSYLLVLLLAEAGGAKRLQRFLTVARFALYYRESLPLAWRAMRAVRRGRPRPEPVVDGSVLLGIAILVVGLAILGFSLLSFLVAVLGLNILVFMRLWRRLPAAQIFVLALIPVPLLLSIGTQIFFVKDFLSGGGMFRMNTIFKFYNQVWILYAISAGAALYYFAVSVLASPGAVFRTPHQPATRTLHKLPTEVQFSISGRSTPVPALPASFGFASASPIPSEVKAFEEEPLGKAPQAPVAWWDRPMALFEHLPIWSAALAILIAASLVYTFAGTVARETYRESWLPERSVPLTLDGMAYMKVAYPDDYAAIQWLNAHVAGAQIIAEAPECSFCSYDLAGRVTMFTGLPQIQGGIHEGEQRWGNELTRGGDINTLYDSPTIGTAWRIIHQYGIRYIFVGFLESHCTQEYGHTAICYSRAGLAKFPRMVGRGLAIAYRHGQTTVYKVVAR